MSLLFLSAVRHMAVVTAWVPKGREVGRGPRHPFLLRISAFSSSVLRQIRKRSPSTCHVLNSVIYRGTTGFLSPEAPPPDGDRNEGPGSEERGRGLRGACKDCLAEVVVSRVPADREQAEERSTGY